jgi:hypothetical protein
VTILQGGSPSLAFIAAVALSNLPEGLSSATGMKAAGRSTRYIVWLWVGIAVVSAASAGLGHLALDGASEGAIAFVMTFAAGAILAMLASTMLPEAAHDGGPVVGLLTSAGFFSGRSPRSRVTDRVPVEPVSGARGRGTDLRLGAFSTAVTRRPHCPGRSGCPSPLYPISHIGAAAQDDQEEHRQDQVDPRRADGEYHAPAPPSLVSLSRAAA